MARGEILKYKDPALLLKVGMQYIDKQVAAKRPVLLTELCLHLGIDIDTLRRYELRPTHSESAKRLKLYVMRDYEIGLHSGKPVGSIFALKAVSGGVFTDGGVFGTTPGSEVTIKWTTPKKK